MAWIVRAAFQCYGRELFSCEWNGMKLLVQCAAGSAGIGDGLHWMAVDSDVLIAFECWKG
jgi:hypothetical protein